MSTILPAPAQIRLKVMRKWKNGSFLRNILHGMYGESERSKGFFPLTISFPSPSSLVLSNHFKKIKKEINLLKSSSKAVTGKGYTLHFRKVNHRTLGVQHIPQRAVLESEEDFIACTGTSREVQTFLETARFVLASMPELYPLFHKKPFLLLDHHRAWVQLLAVCRYFLSFPKPARFIRQLDIHGVDTKFIEQHKGILDQLLQSVLPENAWDPSVSGFARHGFERKYGLRFPEPLIRFRMFDPSRENRPFSDCSIPLSGFMDLEPEVSRVFITENKINGLSFPEVEDAMVIFGLGYGIHLLKDISWLNQKKVYYWGDIDSHGFNILGQVRQWYPQTVSFLMDGATLDRFQSLAVLEPQETRFQGPVKGLTPEENRVYTSLQKTLKTAHGEVIINNIRLEQERIPFFRVKEELDNLLT